MHFELLQDQLSAKASIQPQVNLYGTLLFAPRVGSRYSYQPEAKQQRQVQACNLEPEIWVYSAQLPRALMGNAPGMTTGLGSP